MQNQWTSPSGSRWEPVPQGFVPASVTASAPGVAARVAAAGTTPRRRYRRSVVAVLLALVGVGSVTAGAYGQLDGSLPTGGPTGQSAQVAGGDHGGRHRHGAGS